MLQGVRAGHARQLLLRRFAERSAARRQNNIADIAVSLKTLENCAVFAVDRNQTDIFFADALHDEPPCHDEHFFACKRDFLARVNRRKHQREAGSPDDRAEYHVHILRLNQFRNSLRSCICVA